MNKNEGISPLFFTNRTVEEKEEKNAQNVGIDPFEYFPLELYNAEKNKKDEKEECTQSIAKVSVQDSERKWNVNVGNSEELSLIEVKENKQMQVVEESKAEKIGFIKSQAVMNSAINFTLNPLLYKIYVDRHGNIVYEKNKILFAVVVNEIIYELAIEAKNLSLICKRITEEIPTAIINHDVRNIEKIVENQFREAINSCPKQFVLFQAGWQRIDKKMIYVRDNMMLGNGMKAETGMTLPEYKWDARMISEIFSKASNIYHDITNATVLITYSLLGVLFKPFKEAGYVPRFTLFLIGKSGSMKTALGKVFFTQLAKSEFRGILRRIDLDTAVSLERGIVASGHDTVILIDDYSPAKTKIKADEMLNKLEKVIRMSGDGSGGNRSDRELNDNQGEGVQGMVALTGERMGKGYSTNLRCLYCRFERERVDTDILTWFQRNEFAYTTFIAAFANFVSCNFYSIVELIKKKFNDERKEVLGLLKERRSVDTAVTLRIVCDILKNFLVSSGAMGIEQADVQISIMRDSAVVCTHMSEEMATEELTSVTYVQAISALMRMGQIVLCDEKLTSKNMANFDGFFDETFLYFNPDTIHRKVVAFLRQSNHYFSYELKEILSMLADDRIIKTARNGIGKRTFCPRISLGGIRHNFLKIRRSIFDAIVEGTFDSDYGER